MHKIGRPKADEPKRRMLGIKVTESEYRMVKEYASRHNMTITEILQKGVREAVKASSR